MSTLEQVYYDRNGIRVTTQALSLAGKAYSLETIEQVKIRTQYPDRGGPIVCIILGVVFSPACVGIIPLIVGIIWLANQKEFYWLQLKTVLGTSEPYTSQNLPLLQEVQTALVSAIAHRESRIGTQLNENQLKVQLLKAAAARGGKLSVTQAVMDLGISFAEAEAALRDMLSTGYVEITNDLETGVILYDFKEL